ncbi:glycerophosphoryl diester phosphodiesterase [Lacticaseibacillus camelliae DSM 22697 = JCM 13995]|uniref:Glycerophosphoryl diester phosphodiesterase n=1 Tax=Lacticaseibacillus camelliae DSM 22697 = JCM 13995 TaxID=1423730 RepID=A0A0R2F3H8_9LACO|nr:glycerophosphoryl diester phosphodiesterase [Lacticaseibacillus camelliae DSM 22697 = JCM 13995]
MLLTGFVVIGHRGDPLKAPEETFQSDDLAFQDGAQYVELDVWESADGVVVIQHDPNTLRTTGVSAEIAQTPYATLQGYHTKNGEAVHSLQELFTHYQHGNQKFLIETKIKKGVPHPQLEQKIADLVNQYGMQKRVMFHSFSLSSLKRLQKVLPECPRLFIVGSLKRINYSVFQYVNGVDISTDLLTPQLVSSLHAVNQKVYAWDEMTETPAKWQWLANLNIDGVVTNYPAIAHQYAELKADAVTVHKEGLATNVSSAALPIVRNPYTPTPTGKTVPARAAFEVTKAVEGKAGTYYQISQNQFVPALTVALAPQAGTLNQLIGQRAWIHTKRLAVAVHPSPNAESGRSTLALNNSPITIDAVHQAGNTTWIHIAAGWLKLSQCLLRSPISSLQLSPHTPPLPATAVALRLTPKSDLLNLPILG